MKLSRKARTEVEVREVRLIWGLSIASIVIYINLYLVQGILPLIAATFDVEITHSTLLLSVTSFTMAFSVLLYAVLSDRIGRKLPLMISLYLLLLSVLVMIFVTDFSHLVILRLIQGILLASVPAIAMAYFKDQLSQGAMLKAGAIYIAANSLGGIAGRLLGGALSIHFEWQQVITVILVISIIGVMMVDRLLPSRNFNAEKQHHSNKFPKLTLEDMKGFLLHLSNPKLRGLYLIGGLAFMVMVNQFSFIQLRLLAAPYEWGRFEVTLIFLCYLSGTVASFYSSSWIAMFGRKKLLRLSVLLMCIGSAVTLFNSVIAISLGFLITSFGFFFIHSGCNSWVANSVRTHRAKATSIYLCCYYLGAALGGPLLMPFWHRWGWSGVVLGSIMLLMVHLLLKVCCTLLVERK